MVATGTANIFEYGAAGTGVDGTQAVDTQAFVSAFASARGVILVPEGTYLINATLTPPSGTTILGMPGTVLRNEVTGGRLFTISNKSDVHLIGLTIDGNKDVVGSDSLIRIDTGSTRCSVEDCYIYDAPGEAGGSILVYVADTVTIARNRIADPETIGVGISASHSCVVTQNRITNSGSFGIRLGEAAYSNAITENVTYQTEIEGVGLTWDCYYNRIAGNDIREPQADNGISISGHHNSVVGNTTSDVNKAGIGIWGSYNAITGNIIRVANLLDGATPWSGINITSGYGGVGQFNVVTGNVIHDDQAAPTMTHNVRINDGGNYVEWAQGQAITVGLYERYGLNVYYATTAGTTGATPPTHTTGDVSDGGVTWSYRNTHVRVARPAYNYVGANAWDLVGLGMFDQNGYTENVMPQRGAYDEVYSAAGRFTNSYTTGRLNVGTGFEGWTGVDGISITKEGNAGVAIQSGDASVGRLAFGDGDFAGGLSYSHATDELSVLMGGAFPRTVWSATGNLNHAYGIRLSGILSPDSLTGDVNDYDPTGSDKYAWRLSATGASRTITGILAEGFGAKHLLVNIGAQDIVLAHESGSSAAANRIACPGTTALTLQTNDSVVVWYDGTSARWRVVAT